MRIVYNATRAGGITAAAATGPGGATSIGAGSGSGSGGGGTPNTQSQAPTIQQQPTTAPAAAAAGAAGAAGAGGATGPAAGGGGGGTDPFVAFLQKEIATQQRFLQSQTALAAHTQTQTPIPWGGLIFLAIAVLNFYQRR